MINSDLSVSAICCYYSASHKELLEYEDFLVVRLNYGKGRFFLGGILSLKVLSQECANQMACWVAASVCVGGEEGVESGNFR